MTTKSDCDVYLDIGAGNVVLQMDELFKTNIVAESHFAGMNVENSLLCLGIRHRQFDLHRWRLERTHCFQDLTL